MAILVSGATGFIGRAVISSLIEHQFSIVAAVRLNMNSSLSASVRQVVIGNILPDTDWGAAFAIENIHVVIHSAARVHIMNDDSLDPLAEFRKVNTAGTLNFARQAAESGVKRFIYLSSIKVNGESTETGENFSPDDRFVPVDPYGLSKYEAEQGLLALAMETSMEVVIIRPPLVYGPGVKANFASMMKWIQRDVPLPFGAVHNRRSLVALDNLVSFIVHCIDHPKAANEVFLISDGEDVSTSELLQKVAKAFDKKPFLIPISVGLMKSTAKVLGKADVADRLFGSLQVDSSKARDLLGWRPVITMEDSLTKTVDTFLNEKNI